MRYVCLMLMLSAAPELETSEDAMESRSQRIHAAFNGLHADNMEVLDGFYAPEVVFEDPLGRIEGLPDLRAYYAGMYKNVQEIHFEFTNEIIQDDTHALAWTMTVRARGLNRGRPVRLEGASILRFDDADRVAYHRDYFDLGAMVYEHVPALRCIVKRIKNRLARH